MNLSESWGIIRHESLGRPRSRRDLGLSAVVRFANDYSVPGLAGLSFLRSIVWSLIGIEFSTAKRAEGKPVLASSIAEGLEALACWHSIKEGVGEGMAYRVRGGRKLQRIPSAEGLRLKDLARGRGYVSQPIRMGMGACLPRLDLVAAASSRFNGYELNDRGREFLRLALGHQSTARAIPKLWAWMDGAAWREKGAGNELKLISPMQPLPPPLRQYFSDVMETMGTAADRAVRSRLWQTCRELLDTDAGADDDALAAQVRALVAKRDPTTADRLGWAHHFFTTHAAAFAVLDQVQAQLSDTNGGRADIPRLLEHQTLRERLEELRAAADKFTEIPPPQFPPSEFAPFLAAIRSRNDNAVLLRELVGRDDIVLRLERATISLHPDHKTGGSTGGNRAPEDEPPEDASHLYRLHNLCRLAREVVLGA